MFSKYYQSELQFLRELGREYGEAHPESAGMLVERGGDPDVERLLEGFAFLSARIRERAEAAAPEIVRSCATELASDIAIAAPPQLKDIDPLDLFTQAFVACHQVAPGEIHLRAFAAARQEV